MHSIRKKYDEMSVQLKVVLWFTLCNFFQKGISVVTTPIFTRILSTDEYGVFSVFQAWTSILVIVTTLYLQNAVMNNALTKLNVSGRKIVSSFQSLSLVTTSLALLFYLLFREQINSIIDLPDAAIMAMFVYFIFWSPMQYWMIYERYHFEYKKPIIATVFLSILTPVVSIVAIFASEDKAEARILAYVAVNCIFGLVFYMSNYKNDKTFYDRKLWKYAVSFNLPLIPCFLSETILNQCDRIMINSFCGSGPAGIYSVAYSAAMLVQLFSSALNAAFIPWQYRKLKDEKYKDIEKVGYAVLVALMILLSLVIMFAPELIYILAGENYTSGCYLIPALGASVFFNYMYQLFYRVELYFEKKKESVIATFVSTAINFVLNYLLIPRFGFVAAGYTTLIAHIILCLMHFYFYRNICKIELNGHVIYKGSRILVISFAMLVVALTISLLYNSLVIRLAIMGAILLLLTVNYKRIYSFIRALLQK